MAGENSQVVDQAILDAVEQKFKDAQTDLKSLQDSNKATKQELADAIETIKNQGEILESLEKKIKKNQIESYLTQFKNFLVENKDRLKEIKDQGHGTVTFTPKAASDMSTGSGGDAETVPSNMNTRLGDFRLRNNNDLLGLCTVTSTNMAQYPYTEMIPEVEGYDFVAEGGTKPKISFSWANRYQTPRKIAAHEVLSTEVSQDIDGMVSSAREYLEKKHDLKKVDAVYFADGTGEQPIGATVYARTFTAGSMANAIANPNFMDVVNATITDVYTTHNFADEIPYMPNLSMIDPTDFFTKFQSAKDGNGLPLYPQASLFNRVDIGGVTIIPWYKIPSGKIFTADMSKYNVINYIPFEITIGWINDQFIKNQFTMVGESRFFSFVKNNDQQAFIFDDIETIRTAIAAV